MKGSWKQEAPEGFGGECSFPTSDEDKGQGGMKGGY